MKKCCTCEELKEPEEFYARSDTGRTRSSCKKCIAVKANKRWHTDKDFRDRGKQRAREHQLKKDYGLSMKQFTSRLKAQGNKCAICEVSLPHHRLRTVVDHCHDTGKICGLLCQNCNSGIGFLKDNKDIIKEALSYVERTRK